MIKFFIAVFCVSIFAVAVCAQSGETGKNEFSVWGGFSPDSNTFIRATGRTPDTRFGIVALRYSRRFNNSDSINLKYTADLVPAAFLNYPDVRGPCHAAVRAAYPTDSICVRCRSTRLANEFPAAQKLQPFIEASGGLLYFNKRTPNFIGTRFAFTADIGGGLEFKLNNKRTLTLGYKYYHISNGGRGIENPGFDNNLLYVGYTFFNK